MATVIDQLVVKLGLDSSEFEAGEKRIDEGLDKTKARTEKTGKDIEENGKRAANFFGQIEKAAIKFFAVLTVGRGLSDFTQTVIGTGAQLDRMSGRLGTSADTLSRWAGAVRQSGGTTEGFLGTVQGLSASLTELKLTGNTGILPYLQALGVSVADANGKAKPLEQLLGDIGDKLNALPNKGDAFNIGRNLGIDDGTINLLLKGRTEVTRLLAAQQAYSDADAKAAREAQERWEGVKLNIERTTQAIVIKALPVIERISKAMLGFAEAAVPIILQVMDAFSDLDKVTGGWSTTLIGILATLRLITGAGILGGLGALKTGIAGLALGGAGYAGYKAGEQINEHLSDETKDTIGEYVAKTLAFFGNKEAQEAVRINEGGAPVPSTQPPSNTGGTTSSTSTTNITNLPSRAERNNNPGNLEFHGQAGAEPENGSGRFAKFSNASEGVAALVKQLKRYGGRGLDTLDKIVNTYAPSNENDTQAYIAALSKKLGVDANQKLDLNNADTLAGLVKGISRHESGSDFLKDTDVLTGLKMAGVDGGSSGQQQAPNMSIGEVKVYTQATDATGIARDIKGALVRQADTGMR